jgi:hypothetical protein
VQGHLERGGILGIDHDMDVECEWNARIPRVSDPIQRLQPRSQADFVDVFPERTDVRDQNACAYLLC